MATWLVYVLIALAIIIGIITVYTVLCLVSLILIRKDVKNKDNNTKDVVKNTPSWNIYSIIYRSTLKKCDDTDKNEYRKKAKRNINAMIGIAATQISSTLSTTLVLVVVGFGVSSLNNALNSVPGVVNSLYQDDDCSCYLKCGDTSYDDISTYEAIFGREEFQIFCCSLTLTPEEEETLNEYSLETDGDEIDEFISHHIDEKVIEAYKSSLYTRSDMRYTHEGIDRYEMTYDLLVEDLNKLLLESRTNGRNLECDACKNASDDTLSEVCQGVEPWTEGWAWQQVPDDEDWQPGGGGEDPDPDPVPPVPPVPSGGGWGKATGQYAVQLDDGTYYWYHQISQRNTIKYNHSCVNCGDWTAMNWGFKTNNSRHWFGDDGCAIYSLAIGLSNLVGAEITPRVLLQTLESTWDPNDIYECWTSSNYFFDTGRKIVYKPALDKICATYGLEYKIVNKDVASVDAVLDQDGILWCQWYDKKCKWCSSTGDMHFMMIRKKDADNYYCFTSCGGACAGNAIDVMNYPLPKAEVLNATVGNVSMYAFFNPKGKGGTGGGGGGGGQPVINTKLEEALTRHGLGGKAHSLALFYEAMSKAGYSDEFIAGAMGNISQEGSPGRIESLLYTYVTGKIRYAHDCPVYGRTIYVAGNQLSDEYCSIAHRLSKQGHLTSQQDVTDLLKLGTSPNMPGVGMPQWSGDRRERLLQKYQASGITEFTEDNMFEIEKEYILDELGPGGKYHAVAEVCVGQDVAYCTKQFLFEFEKPNNPDELLNARVGYANSAYAAIQECK